MAVLRECKIWKWNFRGIDKPQPLGPPRWWSPLPRTCTVHYTFKILSLHTYACPCNGVSQEDKKREREGKGKGKKAAPRLRVCLETR